MLSKAAAVGALSPALGSCSHLPLPRSWEWWGGGGVRGGILDRRVILHSLGGVGRRRVGGGGEGGDELGEGAEERVKLNL